MKKTLLAVGAHYDDCVFGIPGILLQAVEKNYRVVVLTLIGDYTNWPPAKGRERELLQVSKDLAHHYGVEMRFLDFASGRFRIGEETLRATAKVVAEVQPDIAFALWRQDRHPDHEVASAIAKTALIQADRILEESSTKAPGQIYFYDNGPGHTIGFEPNVFVDVTDVWVSATSWLGQLMAFLRKKAYDPKTPDPAQTAKAVLARYRGATCGVEYAEALWSMRARPTLIV